MIYNIHGAFIEIEFEQMREYLEILNRALAIEQERFNNDIDDRVKDLSDEEKEHVYEWYSDDYWKLKEIFPIYLMKSFIISWYSFIENQLFRLCEVLKNDLKTELSYKDIEGKGVNQAKKYFLKGGRIKLNNRHWEEIQLIGDIRNVLVHRYGKFNQEEFDLPKYKSYFEKFKLVKNNSLKEFVPTDEFCNHLIDLGGEFFKRLLFDMGKTSSPRSFKDARRKNG